MLLRYKGASDVRTISEGDLQALGVGHGTVEFNEENNFTAEVSDEVAEILLKDPEFAEAEGEMSPRPKVLTDSIQTQNRTAESSR